GASGESQLPDSRRAWSGVNDLIMLEAAVDLKDPECVTDAAAGHGNQRLTVTCRGLRIGAGVIEADHLEVVVGGEGQEITAWTECARLPGRLALVEPVHHDRVVASGGSIPARRGRGQVVEVAEHRPTSHREADRLPGKPSKTAEASCAADLKVERIEPLSDA